MSDSIASIVSRATSTIEHRIVSKFDEGRHENEMVSGNEFEVERQKEKNAELALFDATFSFLTDLLKILRRNSETDGMSGKREMSGDAEQRTFIQERNERNDKETDEGRIENFRSSNERSLGKRKRSDEKAECQNDTKLETNGTETNQREAQNVRTLTLLVRTLTDCLPSIIDTLTSDGVSR